MRVVLDPNVLIAALLSPSGSPARLISRWLAGNFELVVSDELLKELRGTLGYPRLRRHISANDAEAYVAFLAATAVVAKQPAAGTHHSRDPGDDYLLALAEDQHAVLVSGDKHLLRLADRLPVQTPATFLDGLEGR